MGADIQYENGNIHTPVVVIGDDASTEGNVLVSRLATAVSIPKSTLNTTEGTPTETPDEEQTETGVETDAEG